MTKLKIYNLEGNSVDEMAIGDFWMKNLEANPQMIKDYLVALRANARQWSASTKTRGEMRHTTKKPHPQKGQGRARQGSLVSPQYRGGGRVGGPRPKFDQHVKINQKQRRAVILHLLGEKFRNGKVTLIDRTEMREPKTKTVVNFLKKQELGGRILFVGEGAFEQIETEGKVERVSVHTSAHDPFLLSIRNLQKTEFRLCTNLSGYDVILAHHLIVTREGLEQLKQWLGG